MTRCTSRRCNNTDSSTNQRTNKKLFLHSALPSSRSSVRALTRKSGQIFIPVAVSIRHRINNLLSLCPHGSYRFDFVRRLAVASVISVVVKRNRKRSHFSFLFVLQMNYQEDTIFSYGGLHLSFLSYVKNQNWLPIEWYIDEPWYSLLQKANRETA